jgi:hypothetical protein
MVETMTDCTHRCQRLHAHCTLTLSRSIAPDHLWHWAVTMPDGHCWEIKGGMDFQAALASMYYDGQRSLLAADQRWRDDHNVMSTEKMLCMLEPYAA